MLHFEPATPYLETLRSEGFGPRVFHFPVDSEKNLLRQWRENSGDAINELIDHPELVEGQPVFAGHSAGGFTVYVLAAMARGGDLTFLQNSLPGLKRRSLRDLEGLAEKLRRGLFIAIASPLNGVRLTRVGRLMNRTIVEPRVPLLFSGITRPSVEGFYRGVGVRPERVIDGNIVSRTGPMELVGGPFSRLSSVVIQGGMRIFSPFLDHETVNDGIVPWDSAVLKGPRQVFLKLDHLSLVETAEGGVALARLIKDLASSRPS